MRAGIVLIMAALCWAGFASAALVNSKHDFSSLGGAPCGYCHTVHNSLGGSGALMNPGFGSFPAVTKVYSSATMVHKVDLAGVNRSDAPLCLACHDSTTITNNGTLAGVKAQFDARPDAGAYINTDLSNDHPVGFTFDPNLNPTKIKAPVTAHVTFGPSRKEMWCSTCHNVHNNQYGNFLVMSNSGSALCLDCHIK